MDRSAIVTALYERVAAAIGFKTMGRIFRDPSETTSQPAVFLRYHGDKLTRNPSALRGPREMRAALLIYVNGDDRMDKDSEASLYDALNSIDNALAPSPVTNTQTLDGFVIDCWVEDVDPRYDESGKQAVAFLDVRMLVVN